MSKLAPYAKAAVAIALPAAAAVIAAIQALYGAPLWTFVVNAGLTAVATPLGVYLTPNAPKAGKTA